MIALVLVGLSITAPLLIYLNYYYVFQGDKDKAATLLGISGSVTAIVGFLNISIVNFLSRRFDKKKVLCGGVFASGFFYLASWFLFTPAMPYLQILFGVVIAVGPGLLLDTQSVHYGGHLRLRRIPDRPAPRRDL